MKTIKALALGAAFIVFIAAAAALEILLTGLLQAGR